MCILTDSCLLFSTGFRGRLVYLAENKQVEFGTSPALLFTVLGGRVSAVVVVILAFAMVALVSLTIASSISSMDRRRGS